MKEMIDSAMCMYMSLVSVVLHQSKEFEVTGMGEHAYAAACFHRQLKVEMCAELITMSRQRAIAFNMHSIGQRGHQIGA